MQKLTLTNDVEHFLANFERIAAQQKWPKEVWAMQVGRLLNDKAIVAYVVLTPENTVMYNKVKEAILNRYDINEDCWEFRQNHRKGGVKLRVF